MTIRAHVEMILISLSLRDFGTSVKEKWV